MAGVGKVCVVCGSGFRVPPSRAESAKTCSMSCKGKLWTKESADARPQKKCKVCGAMFSFPPSHEDRRQCCSQRCADKSRAQANGASGADNANWKGGTTPHAAGYLYAAASGHPFAKNGNYVFEHRLVMEAWMREKAPGHKFLVKVGGVEYLREEIDVHHIDENKRNNRPANLLACTSRTHLRIHSGEPPMRGEVWPEVAGQVPYEPIFIKRTCLFCGGEFMKPRSVVSRGGGKYCSRLCYRKETS